MSRLPQSGNNLHGPRNIKLWPGAPSPCSASSLCTVGRVRSVEEVQRVRALIARGLATSEIARTTGIPRGTVRDWRLGRVPRCGLDQEETAGCPRCGHAEHDYEALPARAYAYLLGLYFGDGCISKAQRGVFRLRIVLDRKYPGIIDECAAAMGEVMPTNKVGRLEHLHQRSTEVSSWSRSWPCLFPQHGPGKKHDRRIWLSDWQQKITNAHPGLLVRGLIQEDLHLSALPVLEQIG